MAKKQRTGDPPITHDFVASATQKFLNRGKKITVLPPEEVHLKVIVGGEQLGAYEDINQLSTM